MKPTLRSALGFAVACFVGVATAAPTAQWIDFTGGTTNDDGTTSFSIGSSSGWTLFATGRKNNDGSVTLSSPATLSGTGMSVFSVILDCSKPAPTATSRLLSFAISPTESNTVGFLNCSNTSVLQLGHGSGTGTLQDGTGSTYTLGAATRQFITLTHRSANDNPTGTYIYVDGIQALAWSGLKWTSNGNGLTYPHLTVGFNGLTVYGIYLYNSHLANTGVVATKLAGIIANTAYTATIEAGASVAADALDVSDGTKTKKLSEVTNTEAVRLSLAGDATVSGTVTVKHLQVTGTGTLTFAEPSSLTTTSITAIDASTDVSAITASLGTVSVASDKTLTLGANTTVTSFTTTAGANLVNKGSFSYVGKNSALSTNPTSLRVMEGTVTLPSAANLQNVTTAVTVDGGATLNVNGIYNQKSALTLGNNAVVTNGGSDAAVGKTQWKDLTLSEASAAVKVSGNTFGLVASGHNAQPMYLNGGTLTVAMNTDKTFYLANVYAKKTANDAANSTEKAGKIKVESGTLNLYKTNYGTGNNANALSLSRVEVELAGGEVALGESGTSRIGTLVGTSGSVKMGTLALEVGALNEDSTFGGVISGSGTLTKVGSRTLTLTGTNTNTGSLTIAAGAVRFAAAEGAATVGSWAGTVTVNAGATLEVPETAALPTLASASTGALLLTGDGELDMRSVISSASALKAGFAEGATGTLIVPAGSEAANLQVPAGATLKLVLSEAQLAAGRYTYSFTQAEGSTVSFWRAAAEGTLTQVTGKTVGSTFLPTLSFVFTNETGNGQWTDEGNWSNANGAVPNATDAVEIPANTSLTLTKDVSVADLLVTGSGTLTVTGGTLTVTNRLLVVGQLAVTSSQLAFGDNLVAIDLPEEENALDYTATTEVTMPTLTGAGKLKISSGTVTLTGNNTYTGGTTIAKDATVKVDAPGKFGTGEVNIAAGGVVEFYQPGNDAVDHRTGNYSKVTGEGTVRFTGTSWRALPSNAANIWANTLAVENKVEGGLVLVDKSKAYKIGTLSGTGCFRADLGDTVAVATLEVTQRANKTFSGYFHQEGGNGRIPALKVLGESTGILTLSGDSTNTSPATLTVEKGASVVLTKVWAGPVAVDGVLAIGTAEALAPVTLPQAVTEGATGEIVLPAGANLILSADSVFSGSLTGTGTVTVASAKTLTLKPSESKLFAGVIAGAGSLVVGDGTTASTVKLTGANTYTGTTTVAERATLSLAREREEEWVLSDAFGDGSAVIVHGTLELAKGSYCRRTKGAGTIRVLNDQTFAIGQAALPNGETWSADKTTGLTGFTGTLALVGNLKLTNAASAYCTYAPTGFSVRFEADSQGSSASDGMLLCDETKTCSFTLAAGCSLSGEGFILCPITFAASSVIEIKAATAATAETPGVHATCISLTKEEKKATITLPSGEGKHILLKAYVASNGFLLFDPKSALKTSTFAFAADSTLTASTAGVKIFRSSAVWDKSYDTLQVLANPPVPTGTPNVVAAAIRDQAKLDGMPVTVQVVTKDEKKPKVKLEGALFFENVVKTEASYETFQVTATVTYDFGVSAITVKKLTLADAPEPCVVVCAKVESAAIDGTPAVFKKSAQVQLYLNDVLCNAATALTDEDKPSERWFAVPLGSLPTTGTSNFTVKVTEATP